VLILSLSARALAQAARRAGLRVDAMDCFADTDTVASTHASWRLAGDARGFDLAALRRCLAAYARDFPERTLVIGSGFEHCPGFLTELLQGWRVLGNRDECVQALKDWRAFFALLERLAIPYPPVTTGPAGPGWLRKAGPGAGGWQVRDALDAVHGLAADEYFQRWQPGRVLSAVFLADGREARILGCSEQIQSRVGACPCVYAGAVSLPAVAQVWIGTIADWAGRLTAATGLRGLCGLDFILDPQGQPWLLEVNPRPPATFELHDPPGRALFAAHLQACRGSLPRLPPRTSPCHAHAVLYARQPVTIPADFHWPEWAADLPAPGTTIRQGQPVCSVQARGEEPGQTLGEAMRRRQRVETALRAQHPNEQSIREYEA